MHNWDELQEAYFLGMTNGLMEHGAPVDWKELDPPERAERLAAMTLKSQIEQKAKLEAASQELQRAILAFDVHHRAVVASDRTWRRWAYVLTAALVLILTFRHL